MPQDQHEDENDAPIAVGEAEGEIDAHCDDCGLPAIAGAIEEAPRPWRLAKALEALRAQVNAAAPGRSKKSDGTIGDPAHQSRNSDHNPWVVDGSMGVVTALDITHDPANGCDAGLLADTLRKSADPRIKYIISNRRIASSQPKGSAPAWAWRTYTGSNPHDKHCHISVHPTKALYDATSPWAIDAAFSKLELAAVAAPEDAEEEVARALAALASDAGDATAGVPLLARLLTLRDSAETLLTRLSEAHRSPAEDADAGIIEARAPDFETLRTGYEDLFASCTIPAMHKGVVAWHRQVLLRGKPRYREAEQRTGVPWWFIGIIHAMEASFNFASHLHNGDPLTARTVQVPKNRPPVWNPPSDWLSSAIDALQLKNYTGQADWSVARALYRWEAYNGWGYRPRAINSPYLWSFSSHYTKGKFVRDGVFDPNAVSRQCGTAVMLKALVTAGDVTL